MVLSSSSCSLHSQFSSSGTVGWGTLSQGAYLLTSLLRTSEVGFCNPVPPSLWTAHSLWENRSPSIPPCAGIRPPVPKLREIGQGRPATQAPFLPKWPCNPAFFSRLHSSLDSLIFVLGKHSCMCHNLALNMVKTIFTGVLIKGAAVLPIFPYISSGSTSLFSK
jgi:hypothetical protein